MWKAMLRLIFGPGRPPAPSPATVEEIMALIEERGWKAYELHGEPGSGDSVVARLWGQD